MISDATVTELLKRIGKEIGIVLSRQSDHDRVARYLENGGVLPSKDRPLPSELITLVTTNETYFERESHHFDYLLNTIFPELDNEASSSAIRILCAPCSSGEEAYSIALRIMEHSRRFVRSIEVIGIDISEEVIDKARVGRYSQRSIHALSPQIVSRYFIHEERDYRILPLHGVDVRFQAGNVFDIALWNQLGRFDVIFSRNMMIYFDKEKNRELLTRFKEHLNGYLIIGHADDHLQSREMFTPLRTDKGNIYHT